MFEILEEELKKILPIEGPTITEVVKYLKKYSLKDTVKLILETEKINKKKIYDLCLKVKDEKNY